MKINRKICKLLVHDLAKILKPDLFLNFINMANVKILMRI